MVKKFITYRRKKERRKKEEKNYILFKDLLFLLEVSSLLTSRRIIERVENINLSGHVYDLKPEHRESFLLNYWKEIFDWII